MYGSVTLKLSVDKLQITQSGADLGILRGDGGGGGFWAGILQGGGGDPLGSRSAGIYAIY